MLATSTGLLQPLDWTSALWGGLWAGLVAFTIGVSFLLWTRWGYYHLTGKCVLFSVLAHLLLGLFLATAEVVEDVVVALHSPEIDPPITIERVKVINLPEESMSESTIDGRADDSAGPAEWDRVTDKAVIESPSLVREGPESNPPPNPQRADVGEAPPLPQQLPKTEIPVAISKPAEPTLERPPTESQSRVERVGSPDEPEARATETRADVVPDSPRAQAPPTMEPARETRSRPAGSDAPDGDVSANKPPRVPAPLPASGGVAAPESPARPVIRPDRAEDDATTRSGPIAIPDTAARPDVPARPPEGVGVPSSSVRVGAPAVGKTGGGDDSRKRSQSGDTDHEALPRAKIGSSSLPPGSSGSTGTKPETAAMRAVGPVAPGTGADRQDIKLGSPEIYRDRMGPNRSEQAIKRGGSKASEEAVERALSWLAAHQHSDGHWDSDGFSQHCPPRDVCSGLGSKTRDDCAITGLVLLAFLGAGNTHWEGKYAPNVLNGLNWLLDQQKANGDVRGTGMMYSQGIATLALSEALAMSGDPKLRDPVERAVKFIVSAQNPSTGGWRYLPGQYGDTSIFGWQLMALKSASLAGIEVPEATWRKARGWLHLVGSGRHRGLAAYQPTEAPTPPMTAEALVCRVFLGESTASPTLREAADYLMQYKPQWSRLNLYYWYYGTLACFQMGGDYWEQWNRSVRDVLISHQVRSGHAAGSWDPNPALDPWGKEGGRVYSTALAALSLEVYYRFLPLQSVTAE